MAVNQKLAELRTDYETTGLSRASLAPDPVSQFDRWMNEAIEAGVPQANAMVLSTSDTGGRASSRAVLLKDYGEQGFLFFTNLESRKGRELLSNPWAALCFVWIDLHRQVRLEGPIEFASDRESDEYFESRPRQSQLASAASPQSRVVADQRSLRILVEKLSAATGDGPVSRPGHWAGVRVRPDTVEFWQGRPHRLHDRLVYTRQGDGWTIERLAP